MRREVTHVIKHRAPNGALRHVGRRIRRRRHRRHVIKHQAPNGVLRRDLIPVLSRQLPGSHEAPSAKRCIKPTEPATRQAPSPSHKAPSTKRCITTSFASGRPARRDHREKAPSATRRITTRPSASFWRDKPSTNCYARNRGLPGTPGEASSTM